MASGEAECSSDSAPTNNNHASILPDKAPPATDFNIANQPTSTSPTPNVLRISRLPIIGRTDMSKARKARGSKTSKSVKDVRNEQMGLCITDLPKALFIDILLRLPLISVLICRCVCKTWRNLVKDSEFVKTHFSQAETYPLIRMVGTTHVSRILHFVDQPPKYKHCYNSAWGSYSSHLRYCENHVYMKLAAKLKIPLRNAELIMNGEGDANTNLHSKRKRVTKVRPKGHKLNLVNFCNGFLCLSEPYHNDPVLVCNLLTGEFIKLPVPSKSALSRQKFSDCGFGFCTKTNQYKVVRMFNRDEETSLAIDPITGGHIYSIDPITGGHVYSNRTFDRITGAYVYSKRVAEIHTLGTNTWKTVGYAPSSLYKLGFPTYLNGTINWLYIAMHGVCDPPYYIASFDFGKEKFQSIPIPSKRRRHRFQCMRRISIGELRGCLCICDASDENSEKMDLWVMKTYGDVSSWNLEFTLETTSQRGRLLHGLYIPISYFKNGTLLFFHPLTSALFLYDPGESFYRMTFLKVCKFESIFEAIAYRPSFITLKDAVIGDDVEVYNVNSRCGGLKLQGEWRTIYLAEADVDKVNDFNEKSFEYEKRNKAWWQK